MAITDFATRLKQVTEATQDLPGKIREADGAKLERLKVREITQARDYRLELWTSLLREHELAQTVQGIQQELTQRTTNLLPQIRTGFLEAVTPLIQQARQAGNNTVQLEAAHLGMVELEHQALATKARLEAEKRKAMEDLAKNLAQDPQDHQREIAQDITTIEWAARVGLEMDTLLREMQIESAQQQTEQLFRTAAEKRAEELNDGEQLINNKNVLDPAITSLRDQEGVAQQAYLGASSMGDVVINYNRYKALHQVLNTLLYQQRKLELRLPVSRANVQDSLATFLPDQPDEVTRIMDLIPKETTEKQPVPRPNAKEYIQAAQKVIDEVRHQFRSIDAIIDQRPNISLQQGETTELSSGARDAETWMNDILQERPDIARMLQVTTPDIIIHDRGNIRIGDISGFASTYTSDSVVAALVRAGTSMEFYQEAYTTQRELQGRFMHEAAHAAMIVHRQTGTYQEAVRSLSAALVASRDFVNQFQQSLDPATITILNSIQEGQLTAEQAIALEDLYAETIAQNLSDTGFAQAAQVVFNQGIENTEQLKPTNRVDQVLVINLDGTRRTIYHADVMNQIERSLASGSNVGGGAKEEEEKD